MILGRDDVTPHKTPACYPIFVAQNQTGWRMGGAQGRTLWLSGWSSQSSVTFRSVKRTAHLSAGGPRTHKQQNRNGLFLTGCTNRDSRYGERGSSLSSVAATLCIWHLSSLRERRPLGNQKQTASPWPLPLPNPWVTVSLREETHLSTKPLTIGERSSNTGRQPRREPGKLLRGITLVLIFEA